MTSSVGILNQTHDNLEKRIARIEAQLGRPRSCKYGTTAERVSYGAPVEGILWWDTTEEVLYVWYDSNWILAKGVMVGGTVARLATSLPTAGGMWWDTDEDNLYVWGISDSWQTVTGAKFGTREQRDAGGFPGCVWMCTDEGYASVYHPDGYWLGIGDSVTDLNWLFKSRKSELVVMGHRALGTGSWWWTPYQEKILQKSVHKLAWVGEDYYPPNFLEQSGPVTYGVDGLVPYADFSDGTEILPGGHRSEGTFLYPTLGIGGYDSTLMIWFKIHEHYANIQPIYSEYQDLDWYTPPVWALYVHDEYLKFSMLHGNDNTTDSLGQRLFHVEVGKWHFAAVNVGYLALQTYATTVRMDESDWVEADDVVVSQYSARAGIISLMTLLNGGYRYTYRLRGRVSMYYACSSGALSYAQIAMFYERTRRLHGV